MLKESKEKACFNCLTPIIPFVFRVEGCEEGWGGGGGGGAAACGLGSSVRKPKFARVLN